MIQLTLSLLLILFSFSAVAQDFRSLSKDTVHMRYGPSKDHPIKWIFNKKGIPVEKLATFDQWHKVRDFTGEEGWIHKSLLSSKPYGIVHTNQEKTYILMRKKAKKESVALLRIEEGTLLRVKECDSIFCKVSVSSHSGYVEKKYIWGIAQTL